MRQRKIDNAKGIFIIWLSWITGTGALVLLIVLSLWVKPEYMPFVALGLDLALFSHIRRNRQNRIPTCLLVPFLCSRVLFWSALVMAAINLIYSNWIITYFFEPDTLNMQIPFIAQLIVAPILLAVTAWASIRKSKMGFCRDCYIRHGSPAERGFLGKISNQEGRYQTKLLLIIAFICTGISYGYYLLAYINLSLTNLDKFVFVWSTVGLFLVTSAYTAVRYLGLWGYYCKKQENIDRVSITMTRLRYLVFYDNYICIAEPRDHFNKLIDEEQLPDVPVQISLPYRAKVSLTDAKNYFKSSTHIDDADIRPMYETLDNNADNNIFHYLCFLNEEQKQQFDANIKDCRWLTLHELAEMINHGQLATLLSAEFIRLHKIATAWKTYTPDGRKKYKIKHYKPSFRLCDLPDYKVDFNDNQWLYVDDNNEDKPLFFLRKFWRKYINAIG